MVNRGQTVHYWWENPLGVDAAIEAMWGERAVGIKTGDEDSSGLLARCEIRGQPVNDRPAAGCVVRAHQEVVPILPHHHVVPHLEQLALVQVEELLLQRWVE